MSYLRVGLLICSVALLAPAAPSQNSPGGSGTARVSQPERVFERDYDTVWQAVVDVMTATRFLRTADKSSGVVMFERKRLAARDGSDDVKKAIKYWTTQREIGWTEGYDALVLFESSNIKVKSLAANRTDVVCNLLLAAWSPSRFRNDPWYPRTSNGTLETQILDAIESRLPRSSPPLVADENAFRTASVMLAALRKVDAAFKLEAGSEAITSKLIDAQAQFDQFSAGPLRTKVPMTTEKLSVALDFLRKALKDSSTTQTSLQAARDSLNEAQNLLEQYKSSGHEQAPGAATTSPH